MVVLARNFLLFLAICVAVKAKEPPFGIVEPFPENLYPFEYTTAKVTCIAFDASGAKVPQKILFTRRDDLNNYNELQPSDKFSFTNKIEEQDGKPKLFTTMSISNVTVEDDGLFGSLGSYECHAFAVNVTLPKRHGFSVSVITRSEIPEVVVTDSSMLKHGDDITLHCNLTHRGNKASTPLTRISWYKDGVLLESVRNPDPNNKQDFLGPLNLRTVSVWDNGNYTCLLEVKLRNLRKHIVSDYTVIHIHTDVLHSGIYLLGHSSLVIISFILITCMFNHSVIL